MLTEIKSEKCPKCGCREVKQQSKFNLHTNGHWNETLKFECGHTESFSPNFMDITITGECEMCEEYKNSIAKDELAITKLRNYVNKMKCSEKLKKRILSNFQYLKY